MYARHWVYQYIFKLVVCLTILLLIPSCDLLSKKYSFYVIFDNVEGLDDNSIITSKGLKIGEIRDMKLFKDNVIVKLEFTQGIKISRKSIFFIEERGLSSYCIDIKKINADKNFIRQGDTLLGYKSDKKRILDRIPDAAKSFN